MPVETGSPDDPKWKRTPEDGRSSMNLQDLRRATHIGAPHSTAVVARILMPVEGVDGAEVQVPFSLKSVELELHEESGTFTMWLNLEEA